MIPAGATDIVFDFRFGLFGGTISLGAGAELKCKVSREGLEKFAKDNKYKFRSDSYKKNECADGPQEDCDWIWTTFDKYNPPHESARCRYAEKMPDGTIKWEPIKEPVERPKKFLAYNIVTAIAAAIRSSMTWMGKSSTPTGPAINTYSAIMAKSVTKKEIWSLLHI